MLGQSDVSLLGFAFTDVAYSDLEGLIGLLIFSILDNEFIGIKREFNFEITLTQTSS